MDRRSFIGAGASTLIVGAGGRVWAKTRHQVGSMEITTLSDGTLSLPSDFTFGPVPDEIAREVASMHALDLGQNLVAPCNVTLLRHEDRLVIFDAGSGPQFVPSAGKLPDALSAAGVDPGEITHVIFTHAHPDHLWGLLDDFDEPFFFNAQHMIGAVEFDYWADPATVDALPEDRKSFAVGAARRLEIAADTIERFADGEEILPGVAAVMTPGHTPGHMSFELRDAGNSVLVLGDALVNDHIAFSRPAVETGNDQDPPLAAATRLTLLDRITSEDMAIIGFHLSGGGIGRVEKAGEAYRFISG